MFLKKKIMKSSLTFTLVLFCICLCGITLQAQDLINLNPDKNGEPWIVGGLRPLTTEDYIYLNS